MRFEMVNPLKTRVNRYDAETFLGASRRGPVTGNAVEPVRVSAGGLRALAVRLRAAPPTSPELAALGEHRLAEFAVLVEAGNHGMIGPGNLDGRPAPAGSPRRPR
jgi:hypothetical protein